MKKTSIARSFSIVHSIRSFAAIVAILFAAIVPATSIAQSCPSCEERNVVRIRFATMICADTNVNVTLNGATASTTGTECSQTQFSTSSWTYTDLKLDQTYPLTVGTGVCSSHILFDIPDEYTLEINGEEASTINKAGIHRGDGDGTWNIVLKKKCRTCKGGSPGDYCLLHLGSVEWGVSLGSLADGRRAEAISLREETLTGQSYTPMALVYSAPGKTDEVDVVRNPDTSLRQVRAPQSLADIVVVSAWEYEIRFYRPEDVGVQTGGIYPVTGSPFTTWRVRNPDTSNMTRLEISKIQAGLTEVNEFKFDPEKNKWSLLRNGGLTVEERVEIPGTNGRTEIATVRDRVTGQLASKSEIVYRTYAWGEEVLREITYPYDNSVQQLNALAQVEIAPLVTEYSYFENPALGGSYSKVSTIKHPDGSWEKYFYDGYGNIATVLRPWKDQPIETATGANSHATIYKYSNFDGVVTSAFLDVLDYVDETINNVRIKRTTYDRTGVTLNGEPAVREVMTIYSSAAVGVQTIETRYHRSASNLYANRVASIEYPDGRKDTFLYEYGDYTVNPDPSLNQFTLNPTGKAQRKTVTHGTVPAPAGIAFKSTRDVDVTSPEGQSALSETYVYNGASYERVAWSVSEYDDRSHLIQTRNSNGTTTTTGWAGDRVTSEVDANGIQTLYTYDDLNRPKTVTKVGTTGGGGFPVQSDIVTTYNYDAAGRTVGDVTSAGSLNLSRSAKFDLAGRLTETTDEAGLVTIYDYTNGGRTEKVVSPGGAFSLTENFLDGRPKSITGSAIIASTFDYTINGDGSRVTQAFVGDSGSSSPRWTRTTVDWADHKIHTERPGFVVGTNLITTSVYNNKGQPIADSTFAGATRIMADTRYEYDELGRANRIGLDIDADGALMAASTDRFVETDVHFEQNGADWYGTTIEKRFLADNELTSVTTIEKERLTFGSGSQISSELISIDETGNPTITTTTIDSATKKLTRTVDLPESSTDAISISVNGLLQSKSSSAPETATVYHYDGLGRASSVISPRTGVTDTAYDPATGRVVSETNGSVVRSFEFYPAGHLNAGRLRSKANSEGKRVYFEYNPRGEMVRTWGDTVYPIENVYDAYGQRTELRTFRGGKGWQLASFPSSSSGTADTTKWIYHEPTGLMTMKEDAQQRQTTYVYDTAGRMQKRVWARRVLGELVETLYSYDPVTGEKSGTDYSDMTPDVGLTYDRAGRVASVTDGAGTHILGYNVIGGLSSEKIVDGPLDGIEMIVGFDQYLRRSSLQVTHETIAIVNQTLTYDPSSRLGTVTSGGQTATYGYFPTSGLLNTTSYTGGTVMARTYDAFGRVQTVTNTPASGAAQSYTYTYNNLSQRTRITREDGAYWSYVYNNRGEVLSGKRFWGDNTPAAGQQFEYSYDNIGNREMVKSGGNNAGAELRQADYITNSLNQVSNRSVPGAIDILGTSDAGATVTVNNQPTYRRGTYFHTVLPVDNAAGVAAAGVNVTGVKPNAGIGGEDAVEQRSGTIVLPAALESFTYDADGNVLADGLWQYTWDAENRLVGMISLAGVPNGAKRKFDFAYDHQGRRIQKRAYSWNTLTSTYDLQKTTRFVYDGWNLITELDGAVPEKSYVHAGMLSMIHAGGETYFVGHNGSEDVTGLVKASAGAREAEYDYDPFGNAIKEDETESINPFRFSDEYADRETGLNYYGHRYYSPRLGRWIGRDPIEEAGGTNLYAFVSNDGVNQSDALGLVSKAGVKSGIEQYSCGCGWIDWNHVGLGPGAGNMRGPNKGQYSAWALWKKIQNHVTGGDRSQTGKGYMVNHSVALPKGLWWGNKFFVRDRPVLSTREEKGVALAIFKNLHNSKEQLTENLETAATAVTAVFPVLGGFIRPSGSGFAEEDLPSNLISFYAAVNNYTRADVERMCGPVLSVQESLSVLGNGEGRRSRSWKPKNYNNQGCCTCQGRPMTFDKYFNTIKELPAGDFWRIWEEPGRDRRMMNPLGGR